MVNRLKLTIEAQRKYVDCIIIIVETFVDLSCQLEMEVWRNEDCHMLACTYDNFVLHFYINCDLVLLWHFYFLL